MSDVFRGADYLIVSTGRSFLPARFMGHNIACDGI